MAGIEYAIEQSPGLLKSSRRGGTTGAVLWKVTLVVAEWLASRDNALWNIGVLARDTTMLELGCGVAGLVGLAVGPLIAKYVLTDQDYVMKKLHRNLELNQGKPSSQKPVARQRIKQSPEDTRGCSNLQTLCLDWEHDSVQNLQHVLGGNQGIDIVLLCDCVYNDFLIAPLAQTCVEICSLSTSRQMILLIAQQLRSDEVFEVWIATLLARFRVFRLNDEHLPVDLQTTSGYYIYLALLRT